MKIRKIYYWLYIRWLAFLWIFQTNLGDKVRYKGKVYIVANGVIANQWRLDGLNNGENGWVSRKECKKIVTLENILGSYSYGVQFYMGSWYKIWMSQGIRPWVRRCSIWPLGRAKK